MKLIFCQNASLSSLSFPAFSGFFQEMLAAYQNIKYKGCNVGVLSAYISKDNKGVLMAALLFLVSASQQRNQVELLFLFCLVLPGRVKQRSFP